MSFGLVRLPSSTPPSRETSSHPSSPSLARQRSGRSAWSAVTRTRRTAAARSSATREDTAAIRAWAGANGFEVSARGRIAASVREAYENRERASSAAGPRDADGRGRGEAEAPVAQEDTDPFIAE